MKTNSAGRSEDIRVNLLEYFEMLSRARSPPEYRCPAARRAGLSVCAASPCRRSAQKSPLHAADPHCCLHSTWAVVPASCPWSFGAPRRRSRGSVPPAALRRLPRGVSPDDGRCDGRSEKVLVVGHPRLPAELLTSRILSPLIIKH